MSEQSRPGPDAASTEPQGNEAAFDEIMGRAVDDMADDASRQSQRESRDSQDDDGDDLPPLTEQVSQQLGGVRGLIESGIPIGVFVITNIIWEERLNWAIAAAVGVAVCIALVRLLRKQTVRHALNGLFGIAIGAYMAWNSGNPEDFYIFGILQGIVYSLVLMGSVAIRHPLVGWFWSVIAGGGKHEWRDDDRLVRVFGWITMLWGVVFLTKNLVRLWLYWMEMSHVLGIVTLATGYPVTGLLFLITIWAVRRTRPAMALDLNAGKATS